MSCGGVSLAVSRWEAVVVRGRLPVTAQNLCALAGQAMSRYSSPVPSGVTMGVGQPLGALSVLLRDPGVVLRLVVGGRVAERSLLFFMRIDSIRRVLGVYTAFLVHIDNAGRAVHTSLGLFVSTRGRGRMVDLGACSGRSRLCVTLGWARSRGFRWRSASNEITEVF
jgi:hypothetical protein